MAMKTDFATALTEGQREYLKDVAERFELEDEGKAIRCLINFIRESAELEEPAFSEIRCLDC